MLNAVILTPFSVRVMHVGSGECVGMLIFGLLGAQCKVFHCNVACQITLNHVLPRFITFEMFCRITSNHI